jgi:hypothetical protein
LADVSTIDSLRRVDRRNMPAEASTAWPFTPMLTVEVGSARLRNAAMTVLDIGSNSRSTPRAWLAAAERRPFGPSPPCGDVSSAWHRVVVATFAG